MKTKHKKIKQLKKPKLIEEFITIILLCDSPGYRMRSYGPVSLIDINSKKLIDIQIQEIQKAFLNYEIILCVGFDGEKILKYIKNNYKNINIRAVENQLFSSSNSCESVRLAMNNTFNNKILICDGTLLINNRILKLIKYDRSCILTETCQSDNLEIGVNINKEGKAQHFSFGAYYPWSEILFLENENTIELFKKIIASYENKSTFIFEALNEMLLSNQDIWCLTNKYGVKKINNIKTYNKLKGTL